MMTRKPIFGELSPIPDDPPSYDMKKVGAVIRNKCVIATPTEDDFTR